MPGVVDADTHVLESQDMWDDFDDGGEMYPYRPLLVNLPGDTSWGGRNAFWLIDGETYPKSAGSNSFPLHTPTTAIFEMERTDIVVGARQMTDVPTRLKDMDDRGVDLHVVYPTLFIFTGFNNPKLEIALCRAYNSFMAKACADSGGRIHFVMMPPLNSVDACIAEMDRCKRLGSVGMFFRTMETGRSLGDPYFFPIYQEAARLGLPVCIHLGRAIPNSPSALQGNLGSVSSAFMAIVQGRIPEKFPGLKTGFIEFGSLWVPDALHGMHRRGQMKYRGPVSSLLGAGRTDPQLFKDYGMFLTCYADEPLPFILEYVGEENLIIGSDYSHQDASEEEDLVQLMRSREDVSSGVVEKILCENARNFYPL